MDTKTACRCNYRLWINGWERTGHRRVCSPYSWSAAGCGPSTSGLGSSGPHLACDRDHRAVAYAMLALTLIPILDGIVVFKHADWNFKPAILIH
jgi:hypothetical protein